MIKINTLLVSLLLVFFCATASYAGVVYQNFEPDNGLPINVWPVGSSSISIVDRTDAVHSGQKSLHTYSSSYWSGFGVEARPAVGYLDVKQTNNDRLTFWIYARPTRLCYIYGCSAGTNDTVGVRFYDNNKYQSTGFEVWTTQTATYSQWSKLKVLFSQLPPDLDLTHIVRIEFKNYMPGHYYYDDLQVVREDRAYQSFEKQERSGSTDNEYGWKWNDADTVAVSVDGEPAFEGAHSWKLVSAGNWSGTGIQSGDKKYVDNNGTADQSFWHVDLAPENNDRLTFWVYAQPSNGMDNNVSIQVYDNGAHNTDDTKVAYWPKSSVVAGKWSRVTVPFSELLKIAPDLNLKDINKIQFQNYWPGTYYFDDIRAAGPMLVLKQSTSNTVSWSAQPGNVNYRLQESPTGTNGTWKDIYIGKSLQFTLTDISKSFLRVRWEEIPADQNSVIYASPWSEVLEYSLPSVVINYSTLQTGLVTWSTLPQNVVYEVQSASAKFGPWNSIYTGPATIIKYLRGRAVISPVSLPASLGKWYRVRAIQQGSNGAAGLTAWSRPQICNPSKGFVKAVGTVIRDGDGLGDTLTLNGFNLGSLFVIEPWMTGLGNGDNPALIDDWNIRRVLSSRFGNSAAQSLMILYQQNYINDNDLDLLVKHGITMVRLPFYYRNLQDDNGKWIRNASGQIDFSAMDRIVNGLANRGIYVVLDLHGAPGLQSADANTGRANFNKLFAPDGETYRLRTIDLWKQVASHYKNNAWVVGYDLLNEPVGAAPDFLKLADLYDRLYKAIRTVDAKHMIIMEGIWYTDPSTKKETVDWGTLPFPQVRNWTNVMYQFHFYHWNYVDANGNVQKADEDYPSHKVFIDQKVAEARISQPQYNVPVMIGEFYGFGLKSVWDYYIQNFNDQKWSWTSWSYKYHDSPSNWGVVNHVNYDESLPNFQVDSLSVLQRKLSKYTTVNYHTINATLQGLLETSSRFMAPYPATSPYITGLSSLFIEPGQELYITGHNFGSTQSSSVVLYQGAVLPVISWSDTVIRVYIKGDQVPGSGPVTVQTSQGISNTEDIIVVLHDPSMDPPPSNATGTSLPETFLDTFERCNGRPLGTHGCV